MRYHYNSKSINNNMAFAFTISVQLQERTLCWITIKHNNSRLDVYNIPRLVMLKNIKYRYVSVQVKTPLLKQRPKKRRIIQKITEKLLFNVKYQESEDLWKRNVHFDVIHWEITCSASNTAFKPILIHFI